MYLGTLAKFEGGRSEKIYRRIAEDLTSIPMAPVLPIYSLDTINLTEIAPLGDPLYWAPEATLMVRGHLVPTLVSGTTDSRFFRQRGIPVVSRP